MFTALVAALLGFSGLLPTTAIIAQVFFFVLAAFSVLSLLFSLFEPGADAGSAPSLRLSPHESE